ncbi:MAG: hypothetical protein LC799_03930 [Actinobacteria bacterium]|nr:hypothetical protein [Actinomycetota bacterium]
MTYMTPAQPDSQDEDSSLVEQVATEAVTDPGRILSAPLSGKAVDVALAEFNALRTEIVSRITTQMTTTSLGLAALGVVVGFVVQGNSNRTLLLAVPLLTLVVNLVSTAHGYYISVIGNYIREKLWPYLQGQVGMLPSWEVEVAARSRRREAITFILLGAPTSFLFILASILSLLIVGAGADPLLLAGAWLATLITILGPISLNTVILMRHRQARFRE